MWYNIIQNFSSLRCLFLEKLSFEFDDYRGFRAGAGVHKLFVGGVTLLSNQLQSPNQFVTKLRDKAFCVVVCWKIATFKFMVRHMRPIKGASYNLIISSGGPIYKQRD